MEPTKQQIADIIKELYNKGMSYTDIGKKAHRGYTMIWRYRRMEIPNPDDRVLRDLRRALKKAQEMEIW